MLEKLANKRKLIAIIYGVVVPVLLLLEIIFGNPDDKVTIIAATVIGLPFFYFVSNLGSKLSEFTHRRNLCVLPRTFS